MDAEAAHDLPAVVNAAGGTNISSRPCLPSFWVQTQEWNWAILFTSYLLVDVMLPRCGDTRRSVVPRASSVRLGRGGLPCSPKGPGPPRGPGSVDVTPLTPRVLRGSSRSSGHLAVPRTAQGNGNTASTFPPAESAVGPWGNPAPQCCWAASADWSEHKQNKTLPACWGQCPPPLLGT